ncbi:AAA family ATPase [Gracilibacillus dipsosauri]|uniref:Shikimate kinase n=1 Tax=Gracilibacillus dipsosauri TaxID=178340 RepID=A0A317KXM2_9BACI|nr:AAA family ATPase [Gracilibacillus dipsosauri]PWU68247.1 shikimate kinase [Gracilibacillus dipsosauri]
MKFILIFGPQAVGKMTVGKELSNLTGLKLFHNHMTIELLHPFFDFTSEMFHLSSHFREKIFQSFVQTDQLGMIFTYVWAFNLEQDWKEVERFCHIFRSNGAEVYFVELEANIDTRLERNRTPNRLEEKPSKRNINRSEQELKNSIEKYRLNSTNGEIEEEYYIRINNTFLSPKQVAQKIITAFQL